MQIISKLSGTALAVEAAPTSQWHHGHGVMIEPAEGFFLQVKLGEAGLMVHNGEGEHVVVPLAEIVQFAQRVNPRLLPPAVPAKGGLQKVIPAVKPGAPA